LVVGDVTGTGQEVYPPEPLLLRQLHLADERMQVPDEALHDLPEPLRLGVPEAGEHRSREVLVSQVARSVCYEFLLVLVHLFSSLLARSPSRQPSRSPARRRCTSLPAPARRPGAAPSRAAASSGCARRSTRGGVQGRSPRRWGSTARPLGPCPTRRA